MIARLAAAWGDAHGSRVAVFSWRGERRDLSRRCHQAFISVSVTSRAMRMATRAGRILCPLALLVTLAEGMVNGVTAQEARDASVTSPAPDAQSTTGCPQPTLHRIGHGCAVLHVVCHRRARATRVRARVAGGGTPTPEHTGISALVRKTAGDFAAFSGANRRGSSSASAAARRPSPIHSMTNSTRNCWTLTGWHDSSGLEVSRHWLGANGSRGRHLPDRPLCNGPGGRHADEQGVASGF